MHAVFTARFGRASEHEGYVFVLLNEGTEVGLFHKDNVDYDPRQICLDSRHASVECIAISTGSINISEKGRFQHEANTLGLSPSEKYEFYNVLIVHRKDGVAYRDGLGRVEKRAWEAAHPAMVDVTLG
jgi:hypothetical protein